MPDRRLLPNAHPPQPVLRCLLPGDPQPSHAEGDVMAHPKWHDDLRLILETLVFALVVALVVIGLPVMAP